MDFHSVAWLCAFFCFAQVWCLPSNCVLKKNLMEASYTILESSGSLFPLECLDEHVSIPFPQNVFKYNADQVVGVQKAVYQTLKSINALFEGLGDPQWNAKKQDDFRNIVYRQIKDSECIMNKSKVTEDFPSRDASLKVYFETISSVLKEKNFSYCGWEIVRSEILHTLDFILKHNSDTMI